MDRKMTVGERDAELAVARRQRATARIAAAAEAARRAEAAEAARRAEAAEVEREQDEIDRRYSEQQSRRELHYHYGDMFYGRDPRRVEEAIDRALEHRRRYPHRESQITDIIINALNPLRNTIGNQQQSHFGNGREEEDRRDLERQRERDDETERIQNQHRNDDTSTTETDTSTDSLKEYGEFKFSEGKDEEKDDPDEERNMARDVEDEETYFRRFID